jgi:class 3 adenylate cyclase
MTKSYSYQWMLDLKSSPEALWQFVADTNRFNRDTGLPPVERVGIQNGISQMRFRVAFATVEWEENPFDWTYPSRFGIHRVYQKGPMAELRVLCELTPLEQGGTRLTYQTTITAANWFGHLFIPIGIGWMSGSRFEQAFRRYDELAQAGKTKLDAPGQARLITGAIPRLNMARSQLKDARVAQKLTDLLQNADDLSLARLRPYALADYWGLPRRAVLENFLQAAQLGILDLRWDLICPMCRGAAESAQSLREIHANGHCPSCQMDFEANFDRQVEVTFRPSAQVRDLSAQPVFCVGSPQNEPHIVFVQGVAPGAEVTIPAVLQNGLYELAAGEHRVSLRATPNGEKQVRVRAEALHAGETEVALEPVFHLFNGSESPLLFFLEQKDWSDTAATAADVTSLQVFRNLFSSEALRPGEELGIQSLTLMFTDLRDSTRMYRQIGDAQAFGRVRQHFEILEAAIESEGGAIVKTMGDAVMAVFQQPVSALRAARAAYAEIERRGGSPELFLKVGVHRGACIAVTLNERLDYFGSTVNMAARLPGLAQGGEIIFSDAVMTDPEVAAQVIGVQKFEAQVKGFDEPVTLYRMGL